MRVGQNKLTYRWARKGSRPRAAHDQRTQSTYLFGALCPELGTGAALVLPFCNSEAMQLHLDEIATKVGPGAHAIIILDQAGWHGAKELKVPQHLADAIAAAFARPEQPGEYLAVHAPKLAEDQAPLRKRIREIAQISGDNGDKSTGSDPSVTVVAAYLRLNDPSSQAAPQSGGNAEPLFITVLKARPRGGHSSSCRWRRVGDPSARRC